MKMQLVELHFSHVPQLDSSALKQRAEAILGDELDVPESQDAKDVCLLFHKEYPVQYADRKVPAQTAILAAHKPIDIESYAADIQQSWRFRDCEPVLSKSCHTLLVAEMMANLLTPAQRVRLFHGVLQAAIEATQPEALVFKHSQQVVQRDAYLSHVEDLPILRPGSLNVRLFNILNSEVAA